MKRLLAFLRTLLLPILLLVVCIGIGNIIAEMVTPPDSNEYHRVRAKHNNQLVTKSLFIQINEPLIYISTFDGIFFAISYRTGNILWKLTNKFQMYVEAEYFRSNFNDDIYFSHNERMSNNNLNKNASSAKFQTNYTVENEYIVPSIDGTLYHFKNNQYRIVTDTKQDFMNDTTTSDLNYIRSTNSLKLIGLEPWSGEILYECNGATCSLSDSTNNHHNHHVTANNPSASEHLLVMESQMFHRFNTNLKNGYVNWNMSYNSLNLRYVNRKNEFESYKAYIEESPTDNDDANDANDDNNDEQTAYSQHSNNNKIQRECNHTTNILKFVRYDALNDVLENTRMKWKLHLNSPIVKFWSLSTSHGLDEVNLRNLLKIHRISDVVRGLSEKDRAYCENPLLLFNHKGQPYFVPIVSNPLNTVNNHSTSQPSYCTSIYTIKEFVSDDFSKKNRHALTDYEVRTLGLFDSIGPISKVSSKVSSKASNEVSDEGSNEGSNEFQNTFQNKIDDSPPYFPNFDSKIYIYKVHSYGSFEPINARSCNLQLLPAPYNEYSNSSDTMNANSWTYFFSDILPYYSSRLAVIFKKFCVVGSLITVFYNSIYFVTRKILGHFSRLPESSPLTIRKGSFNDTEIIEAIELVDLFDAKDDEWEFVNHDELQHKIITSNNFNINGGIVKKASESNGTKCGKPPSLNESVDNNNSGGSLTPQQPIAASRYHSDFIHIKKLGKGGFGHVYMAKNIIDQCEYAIKRIRMPECNGARSRVMREVQALAKLNHPGVVRFYNAWYEPTITTFDSVANKQKITTLCVTLQNDSELSLCSEGDDSLNSDEDIKCEKKPGSSVVDFYNPFVIPEDALPSASSKSGTKSIDSYPASCKESECHGAQHSILECMHNLNTDLYIQMQLCQSQTLHDWLENNTSDRNISTCLDYFKQILLAISYIHSQGFIHRDLKPSNIFFSMDGIVKIGDFGLVAHTLPTPKAHEIPKKPKNKRISVSYCSDNINLHYYTKMVGTELYMAPEQNNCEKYDNTVDIFALALILTELMLPFQTQTERYITLTNMKTMKKNSDLAEKYPTVTLLVEWMLADDPKNRPTAEDILNSNLIQSLWAKYNLVNTT